MFRTLTSRLTLWQTALFGALALVIFCLVYFILKSNLRQRMDEELINESSEFETLYHARGAEALRAEFKLESESEGVKRVFYRFFSPDMRERFASDLGSWKGLGPPPPMVAGIPTGMKSLATISIAGQRHNARVIYRKFSDGNVVQLGATLEDDDELLGGIREIFGIAIVLMLLCGGAIGWFVATRAMRGVERVTHAAIRIGPTEFGTRLPSHNEGEEIVNLTNAFNAMLERIQSLVAELKGVTDNIAHDLRSPLTRIRGIAETTMTGVQSVDEYRQMAGMVIEECDRLVGMINTMLEIAQADSGAADFSRVPVDMVRVANDARDLFHPAAEDKGVAIETDFAKEPLFALGDVARLQRLVANLLDNAIKYTDSGGRVLLSLKGTPEQVILSVRDTGAGIDKADMPNIFGRFYRGDRSRSTPGSGLGLSLAESIVRAHGGGIFVESTPGKGSTFTVRLPRIAPIF